MKKLLKGGTITGSESNCVLDGIDVYLSCGHKGPCVFVAKWWVIQFVGVLRTRRHRGCLGGIDAQEQQSVIATCDETSAANRT